MHSIARAQEELAEYLHIEKSHIYDEWLDHLRVQWGEKAETKIAYVLTNKSVENDLFSILLHSYRKGIQVTEHDIEPLNKIIRSLDYSVSDFYTEVFCLEQCLYKYIKSYNRLTDGQLTNEIIAIHQRFSEINMRVLEGCAEVFENIAETSKTAICQTDEKGRIVFANQEMNMLTEENKLIGKPLIQYFDKSEKELISKTILDSSNPPTNILRLNIISAKGKRTSVNTEIGTIKINEHYKGGYAHFTDISLSEQQNNQLFNRALLGIIKLNIQGDILFANKSMLQMLNLDNCQGINVYDLLPDDETKGKVAQHLKSRGEGHSDEYPLELLRSGDNSRIPVMVSAFPETDLEGKKVIGSFAIIRCMVADRMHQQIECHHDEITLLESVSKELSQLVRFDLITVSMYPYVSG